MSKPYRFADSIITDEARFIHGGPGGQNIMFHAVGEDLGGGEFCNHQDAGGFCRGHVMSRERFVYIYCKGVMPRDRN